jgi:hypothetical protein
MPTDPAYETTRPLARPGTLDASYVKDTEEWVARCVIRVHALDPMILVEEAQTMVRELATVERWRVLKPEEVAEQLYTPITSAPSRRAD